MRSQASSNSQAAVWYSDKVKDTHDNCESPKKTPQQPLKRLLGFTVLIVLAAFLYPRFAYAEITVPCVEGSEPLALPFGASTTGCAIDIGTDTDTFEFTGNAGDEIVLNLRTLSNGLDPNMSLRDPNGVEIATDSCTNTFTCGIALTHTLPMTGTYLVTIGETGMNNTGNYVLQLEKLFPAVAPTPLVYDVAVTEALSPGTDMDFYTFTGNAGDEIVLNLRTLSNGLDPNMSLRDPNGVEIAADSCTNTFTCGIALTHTLPMTGTYLVTIGETGLDNAGNYNLQLEKLFPAVAPTVLEYDIAVTEALSPGTDMDFYTFTGNAGDEIVLNLRTLNNGLGPNMTLRDQNGVEIAADSCSNTFTCGFALTHTLPMTGTYLVTIGETGLDNAGNYNLQLEKLFPAVAPTVLEYDIAVTEALSPGTDMDFYTFTGNAGDEIVLNLRTLNNGLGPNMTLRDQNGVEIAADSCTNTFTCGFALTHTLPMTGTYLVTIGETGLDNAGNYNLQLEKLFPAVAPTVLEYDVEVTEALSPGTDMDFYTFTGNRGDEIVLNLRTLNNGLGPNMTLRDQNGIEIATDSCSNTFTCGFALTHTLPMTGTYLVTIGETGLDNAGNYNLQLEKLFPAVAPTVLEYDIAVTEALSPGTDMDFYTFTGNAGDEIVLNLRTLNNGLGPNMTLRDQNGVEIAADSCSNTFTCGFALTHTLPMTGTYLVTIGETGLDNAGNYNLQLEKLFPAVAPTPLVYDVTVTETLSPGTDMDFFSFVGNAGDQIALNLLTLNNGLDPNMTLRDPNGAEVATNSCASTFTCGFTLPHTLTVSGTYLVIVGETGLDNAGNFQITLECQGASCSGSNAAPVITNPGPQVNIEGDTISLPIVATDSDVLEYGAIGLPAGLTIDPDTGVISGTLGTSTAGSYNVIVTVTDNINASEMRFTWTVNPAPPPVLLANPTEVYFGEVIVGASAVVSFDVLNPGTSPVMVTSIQSSDAAFTVLPPNNFAVAPGKSKSVNIDFTPTAAGNFDGIITLLNNAGADVTVNVLGRGLAAGSDGDIDTVDTLEFIDVEESVAVEQVVTVTNTGAGLLTVSSAVTNDLAFEVFTTPGDILPLTLNPAETRNLIVRFTAPAGAAGTTVATTLDIGSDDVDEAVRTVALTGSVVAPAVSLPNNSLVAAQVTANLITAANCSSVGGDVQFSSDSSSTDSFKIVLAHQNGAAPVESAFFSAIQGAGATAFSGINACGLPDGVVEVLAVLDKSGTVLPAFTGTPAVKNTGLFGPPVLGVVPVFSLSPSVEICGTSRADTTVRIEGGASVVSVKLDSVTTAFCLDVPLRRNAQNILLASAIDDLDLAPMDVATAPPVQIVQVDLANVVVTSAFSRALEIDEINELVADGVISLSEAANFNVSMFTVVLTIGSLPVTISQPVVINPVSGAVSYGRFRGGVSFGGWSGGGAAAPPAPRTGGCVSGCVQIVVIKTESGQTIPGVIIIDGRIKTLKEFFQVGLALFNNSGIFDLSGMNASIDVPGGLTPIRAGIGLDVSYTNLDGEIDSVLIGDIAPGETGIAQFLIRGDGIGRHQVDVDFDGSITGGGLPVAIPVAGSATTTVEVTGPPELGVVVRFPSNPSGPDVILDQIYTLTVDITNLSDRPALYTSLELFIGGDAVLVDEDDDPVADSSSITTLGTILPNTTQSVSFRVKSLIEGEIIACQAVAAENILLTVDTGPAGAACRISNTLPANFVPLPPVAAPTVIAINPLNGESEVPLTSSVFAIFTPQAACIVADTWTNVVTANIDPFDPGKGLKVVSADLVTAGTFYLEELDWTGSPVQHIPVDLTLVDPTAGGTTIATLRLGLDSPHPNSQYFLRSDTAYRATIIGGTGGVCSTASGVEMNSTFSWIFNAAATCDVQVPPSVNLQWPANGTVDRTRNVQITLDFLFSDADSGMNFPATMDLDSFVFDPGDFAASSFGVYINAVESAGDITGGTAVSGTLEFSGQKRLYFVPDPGELTVGDVVHVRLTDQLTDDCGNPLETPPNGVKLFKFDVVPIALP